MLNSLIGIIASSGGAAAASNSYESIATTTVGSGGVSSVTFSSIPSTYQHLQIRVMSLFINARLDIQFNADTSTNYSYHLVQGDGSGTYAEAGASTNSIRCWPNGNATNIANPNLAIIDVLDYANTNKYKTARILNGFDQNGSGIISLNSGAWRNTNAITSIVLAPNTGNFAQYSSFALYGIKG
jgi:hypothetical protein